MLVRLAAGSLFLMRGVCMLFGLAMLGLVP
jgi:hypothetical protein